MDPLAPSLIERLRQWDERRASLPGEHWMTAAIGLYLLLRPRRSLPARLASSAAGGLLVARALAGRDGLLAAVKRASSQTDDAARYIDVAAPWPYEQRVRISAARRTRRSTVGAPQVGEPA